MKYVRAAGACAAFAALAVPTAASAHGTVYSHQARVVAPGDTPPIAEGDLVLQDRYVVTNHGFTYVLSETNGLTDHGMVDYSQLPGAYRNQPGFEPGPPGTRTRLLAEGDTGAQPHATCDVPALTAQPAILGWQGDDPFYNYVPFQKAAAGLEDDPAAWIADVQDLVDVDLNGVGSDPVQAAAELEALCENLPGATPTSFHPADATQTATTALASGTISEATAPLEARIATLQTSLTTAERDRDAARTALASANTELARVIPLARELTAALPTARMRARSLASNGARVSLTGPPLRTVALRLTIPAKAAKKIGLKSGLLARTTTSIGAGGAAQATLRPNAAVRRALQRLRGSAKLTLTAAGGDRADAVTGRVAR
jgi:hypothetical protein